MADLPEGPLPDAALDRGAEIRWKYFHDSEFRTLVKLMRALLDMHGSTDRIAEALALAASMRQHNRDEPPTDECADKRNAARWRELCKVHDRLNLPPKKRAEKVYLAFVRLRYHQVEESER